MFCALKACQWSWTLCIGAIVSLFAYGGIEFVHLCALDIDEVEFIWVLVKLKCNVDKLQMEFRYVIVVVIWNGFGSCFQP